MPKSIRSRILLAILAVTMITACSITVVFYFRSAAMIKENYAASIYGRVKQTVTSLDDSLQEIYYINVKAAEDPEIAEQILSYGETGDSGVLDALADKLRSYRSQYRNLSSLYLVLPKEQIAVTSEDYPTYKKDIPAKKIELLQETQQKEAAPLMMEDFVHNTGSQFSCVQAVMGSDGKVLGYMLANMEERTLYYEYLEPVYDEKVFEAVLLDQNQAIITSEHYGNAGQPFTDARNAISGIDDDDPKEIHILYTGAFSKCALYMSIRKSEILKDLQQTKAFLAFIFLLVLMVGVLLAAYLTRVLYRPIKKMTNTVEQISEGDWSLRVEINVTDEIGTLCREFNHMLDCLEDSVARSIEEERLKKDAELDALQYQITPHFMYNTLNSIKYAALIKGDQELGRLIGDFVELLQASINKKGTFITVADEVHILENYIHLQEFRYRNCFEVEYDIDKEACGCFLPRLILQPLVENAILHGMDMKEEKGRLIIRAKVEGGRLSLFVIDNGRGMTQEQINILLTSKVKKNSGLSAIGIPNVKERLSLYYGDKGGITYESDENGTTAMIFLPVFREEDRLEQRQK